MEEEEEPEAEEEEEEDAEEWNLDEEEEEEEKPNEEGEVDEDLVNVLTEQWFDSHTDSFEDIIALCTGGDNVN